MKNVWKKYTHMPYGPHQGTPLDTVTRKTLETWRKDINQEIRQSLHQRAGTVDELVENVRAIKCELERRDNEKWFRQMYQHGTEPPPLTFFIDGKHAAVAIQIIKDGYRIASKHYHPDVGGTHEQMILMNETITVLREAIRQWEERAAKVAALRAKTQSKIKRRTAK
jgi:hypothetical protein